MLDLSNVWPELKVIEKLGEGSFGKVYKCEREELGMKLYNAVKVISIPANKAEYDSVRKECQSVEEVKSYYGDIVSDFSNEIRLMLMLKGAPNIVSVDSYKIVEHADGIGSDIYICMEYLSGFSSYMSTNIMDEKEVVRLGKEISNALIICSGKGIIHRDIKPDNIFVDSYGSYKLGDFGVARRLEGSMSMMSKKGTYSYMAPEVFRGEKYDSRADIYSLGMVMYKLLNRNREPFVDLNKSVVGYNDRSEAIERRRSGERLPAPVDASPAVAAVILKACEFNPIDRYASAAEFRQALEAAEETCGEEDKTSASGKYFENTVVANGADVSVPVNGQFAAGGSTVQPAGYVNYPTGYNATVIADRPPTVAPEFNYGVPPVVNAGYNPQMYNGVQTNQTAGKKKGTGGKIAVIVLSVVAVVAVVIGVLFAAGVLSKKEEPEPIKGKEKATVTQQLNNEKTEDEKDTVQQDTVQPKRSLASLISAGEYYTVAVKNDGTVVATQYLDDSTDSYDNYQQQCEVYGWKDIVAVAAGKDHTVGLKADGTVVAVGNNDYGKCDVGTWKNIVAVAVGMDHTVGLKADGTVVAVGDTDNVSDWRDIVAVSAGNFHTVGLKSDGTVVAVGSNLNGACNVSDWRDIVAVECGYYHTVGVKSDGTVVAVGKNDDGQCNVSGYKNVVAVSASFSFTVLLKSDGTVEVVGNDSWSDTSEWKDIVAISTGFFHTVGIKSDGTVAVSGYNDHGQCDVGTWRNIK